MSRLIHVLIVEQGNSECFSIGVIDNITIGCKESFMPRLKSALDEHFDGDVEIATEFIYEDLFGYSPVKLGLKVNNDFEEYYTIYIAETWLY
jgi:hypothetical protein